MRLAIIGAGPGGYVAAIKAAQLGAKVTVIEKDEVGGTCLSRGCIPAKALNASAGALRKARRLGEYGIEFSGEINPDIAKIMDRKNRVVSTQVKGIRSLFKFHDIKLVDGNGKLLSSSAVEVVRRDGSKEVIEADKLIIATGSRPALIPSFPFDGENILSSDDILNLKELPKSLIIIGAGAIGCEFACIFAEFGVEITIVELLNRAVSTEDEEISALLERELKKKKINLLTGVRVEKAEKRPDGIQVFLEGGKEFTAEKLLVSIGRSYNTEDIGLETLGIQKGGRGEIRVNAKMETNVPGIYAIGDVVGGLLLAHVASKEGVVAATNACGGNIEMDYSAVPWAIMTFPEIGSVGMREFQARDKGLKIKTGRFPFRALGKAHAIGEIAGIIKVVADADSDKVIGVHIIGPRASDIIHEGALAVSAGLTADMIGQMVHAHPTLSEGLMEASADAVDMAIHAPK